jgi:peptidoglycan/xylan/chitin deacetylase (PgdA/CDA1 family)
MEPQQRLPYLAPQDRPVSRLPGGQKLIIWPVVNVEVWRIGNPMPRQVLVAPTGVALQPDIANWAWHEYGMRVGFWRMLAAFHGRGIRPTLSVNGAVCIEYPRVAAAAHDAGWEFMGHGLDQVPTHKVADQRAMIAETIARITACTGGPPVGWLGPGLTQTLETPDLLAEAGIRYCADFVLDELPVRLATAHGPLLTMPYSVELNDIPICMIQHLDENELPRRALLAARRLLAEATDHPRVLCFAIHPYITGVPHRIGALERMLDDLLALPDTVMMQGREILAWYLASGDPS